METTIAAVAAVAACAASLAFILRERALTIQYRIAGRVAAQTRDSLLAAVHDLILASRESPDAVLAALDAAIRSCVADIDTIAVFKRDDDRLVCTYASGDRLEYFKKLALAVDGEGVCARAVRGGFRAIARRSEAVLHPSDRVSLAVPFLDGSSAFAALSAGSRAELQGPAIELVVALVEQATPAYILALERNEDRARATRDGLTGLLTPRAFRNRFKDAIAYAAHDPGERLALLFVDTDHFKEWNDTFGHASGDAVLRRLADVLRSHATAAQDLVARNGGDEFCLVFAEAEKSQAIERGRLLCHDIARLSFDAERPAGTKALQLTASIGIAAFPCDARTADELLEKADAAMYHSKHTGRNRVSFYLDGALTSAPSEEEIPDDRAPRC